MSLTTERNRFVTISGSTNVRMELKNAELEFDQLIVKVDLPVIDEYFFGLIIGSDILEHSLEKCVISFNPPRLLFNVENQSISMDMFPKKRPV